MIQISSKSRLSSWSSPDIKLRSRSVVERNSSLSSLTSLRHSKLGDLPRSFSDSCLAKRRLDDDEDEFKNPSSSAPQSCSGSSGSDEDEDEGSGETEEMVRFEPSVNNTSWIVSIYNFSLSAATVYPARSALNRPFPIGGFIAHFRAWDDSLENSSFQVFK